MPNSVFGNIFAIPQIDTRGIAAGVPKYNPMSGLAALIQAQNAVMRQARAAAGSAPLQPGQYKGVGDPSKGKWVKLPGVQDPVWIVGASDKERAANEAKALNEARAAIIQSDTELQNQLNGLSEKSVPAQQEVLAAVRSNGTIARMAQKLEMSEADTAKLLLDTPTQELAKRQKAINDAGFFRQLRDAKEAILDKFSATVRALGASAEERAALGQELQTKAEQRLQNNARADEFRRLEQEGRSTADYWIHNPIDTATMYAAPIAATVLPQIAGGVVGTMVGGPAGGLAGAVLGGGLSSAAYGGGEMLQRAATDPNLTTPEQRAQAADSAFAPGALISGAIGAIPFGPSSVATTFGRRAAANTVRGLPEYAAATTKERAAMVAQEYARQSAEHGFARRIGSSYLAAASDAAALGIAEQAGHNLAYGAATGQDIPVTEGWAEQGLASAVLGLPFAAVMGRRARYLYPGGRYPTPEPGPVVSAEVLPQYGLPPAAPMFGGAPPPTGPQGGGSAGGAARATGGPQGARASSTPGSEQANATADATIAQMNEAIRRNPANMAALEQLDAEVSKQVSDVAATVQKAKSASTLEKQLTRQLEQQGVDPAVLERLALSYPDTSWRKQALIKVLDKHQAALPPAEVVSLPPSVQDILGREAAELEAYRGNPPANATGRISESPADMATDEQLREGEVDTTNLAANRAEPVYPEAAAPAAADQPLAEARVSDTATEGRGDAGAAAPDTGTLEAVAAAPRGQESGGTPQPDGESGGGATASKRAAADTGERGVESEAGAGPRSRGDGTNAGGAHPVARGDATQIINNDNTADAAHYEVRELNDLIPSHDPDNGFAKRPDYPKDVQERPYHSDRGEQDKVRINALQHNTDLVLTDNPAAENGPPIIAQDGVVLGGNSRVMTLQLVYGDAERGANYRNALLQRAQHFGVNPNDVASMRQPVLVRTVEGRMTPAEMAVKSRKYNQGMTQKLQSKAEGVSRARLLSTETLNELSTDLAEFNTLREYFADPKSRRFVQQLQRDGVIDRTEAAALIDKDGRLNARGKDLVEDTLRGLVMPNYDVLAHVPASILNKLDKAIPALARLQVRGEGWDITNALMPALRHINEAQRGGRKLSNWYAQVDMLNTDTDKGRPAVQVLARTLDGATQKEVLARFEAFAKAAERRQKGRGSLMGTLEAAKPESAFIEAFMRPIASMGGKPVANFNPAKNSRHAALAWAAKHGGESKTVAGAQSRLESIMQSSKASAKEKVEAKERLGALSGYSGPITVYEPKLENLSYRKGVPLELTSSARELSPQAVENIVEQAKEQGFRISEKTAVTKNPTESAAKIIDNPNCTV